ncbi:sugar-binding domain-containing protein [Saxibacter everestensis]|uniref:Sugar-binding domain-containing protein n=1 Tax=Saxibacter everestensis TaxID=2909229 RepID=A0ABY8QUH0_9MICO|nr:sugar-binding domain-containing protein [Brevibacteriaceae bacterium ZFBP1038]
MVAENKAQQALRIAHLYYVQGVTMEAIARQMRVSRSTVSRLLKYARDAKLVEITLNVPHSTEKDLEKVFRREFGISAQVVPVADSSNELERLETVTARGAKLLGQIFGGNMTLGIAWGTTTAAVGRQLVHKVTRGANVVQLNGAANPSTTGIGYAADVISRFGAAFDAPVQHFPVPAFFDYAATRKAMWQERSIKRILRMQRNVDVALFSVGAVAGGVPSHVYTAGYLDDADFRSLRTEGVVGDINTVFIRADGSHHDIPLNQRASGIPPDELRRIHRRLCVVSGENKVPALRAALASHLVTDLVIDEPTASSLLEV